jgi:prefoldin subunit 5
MNEKLRELRLEFEKGQQQMAVLEQRRQELRDTMLRISGAIQVLEEMITQNGNSPPAVSHPSA